MKYRWYTILPYIFVLSLAFILSLAKLDDLDVWWHLKCGELLVREGRILREDIFSYTAFGNPWVDGYLPVQAVMYMAWWLGGAAGVIFFSGIVVTVAYGLALAMSGRSGMGFGAAMIVAIPAIVLPRTVFLPRPALLSPIFVLLTLYLLEKHTKMAQANSETSGLNPLPTALSVARQPLPAACLWLIALTWLWANCHPGFFLGPFLTFVYLVGPLSWRLIGKKDLTPPKRKKRKKNIGPPNLLAMGKREKELLKTAALQIVATFINPYGYKIYYSTFSFLQNFALKKRIVEWAPIFSPTANVPPDLALSFFLLAAWGLACILYSGLKSRPEHVFLFVFLAVASFYSRRNIIIFGPLSLPLISWIISENEGFTKRAAFTAGIRNVLMKSGACFVSLLALFLVWAAATDRFYFYTLSLRSTGLGIQSLLFPEKAVNLLKSEKVSGNLFHSYDMGGYLLFRLYPQYKVIVDGRIYPYSMDTFNAVQSAFDSLPAFLEIEKKYSIGAAIMHMDYMGDWPQINELLHSPNWAAVQADDSFVLFLRRGPGNDPIIKKHEIDLLTHPPTLYTPPPGRSYGLLDRAELPSGPFRWALFYKIFGKPDLAAQSLRPFLNYHPLSYMMNTALGGLLIQAGKLEEGFGFLEQSLKKNPNDIMALRYKADYYIKSKDFDKAELILVKVVKLDRNVPEVWNTLGEIAFNKQDYQAAARRFRMATNLRPDQRKYWEKLGISLQFINEYEAKEAFRRASEISTAEAELPSDVLRIREQVMKMHR